MNAAYLMTYVNYQQSSLTNPTINYVTLLTIKAIYIFIHSKG